MKCAARRGVFARTCGLLLLLVAGAAVNIAVAWGCVLLIETDRESIYFGPSEEVNLLLIGFGLPPSDRDFIHVDVPGLRFATTNLPSEAVVVIHAGWPMCALSGGYHVGYTNTSVPTLRYAIELSAKVRTRKIDFANWPSVLPLRPIWPGFAINTAFYAAICWLLFAAPFAVRRYRGGRRIKRGLCPACAYPVGTNDLCTECGKPVTRR